ncbi:MAG: hypothetical protein FJX72_12265 [Armatimonadetes bacterium]|nr:hypothetical protein [Armatimonadota bacterium]
MNCPNCADVALTMADRMGVEIDYCPKCRGIWLDRGELDKLIERSGSAPVPPSYAPGPDDRRPPERDRYERRDDDDDRRYGGKRKRNFLEDIFDF